MLDRNKSRGFINFPNGLKTEFKYSPSGTSLNTPRNGFARSISWDKLDCQKQMTVGANLMIKTNCNKGNSVQKFFVRCSQAPLLSFRDYIECIQKGRISKHQHMRLFTYIFNMAHKHKCIVVNENSIVNILHFKLVKPRHPFRGGGNYYKTDNEIRAIFEKLNDGSYDSINNMKEIFETNKGAALRLGMWYLQHMYKYKWTLTPNHISEYKFAEKHFDNLAMLFFDDDSKNELATIKDKHAFFTAWQRAYSDVVELDSGATPQYFLDLLPIQAGCK